MKNAFGIEQDEVSKLGSPKVKYQELTAYNTDGPTTTTRHADTVQTSYKGKSAILRRPKYQAVGYPSGKEKWQAVSATPNMRVPRGNAERLAAAHQAKSRKVMLEDGTSVKHVSKREPFGSLISKARLTAASAHQVSKGTRANWTAASTAVGGASGALAGGLVGAPALGAKIGAAGGALEGAAVGELAARRKNKLAAATTAASPVSKARLTAAERNALPDSAFADPKRRRFPMEDKRHAEAALGRAHQGFAGKQLSSKIERREKKMVSKARVPNISTLPKHARLKRNAKVGAGLAAAYGAGVGIGAGVATAAKANDRRKEAGDVSKNAFGIEKGAAYMAGTVVRRGLQAPKVAKKKFKNVAIGTTAGVAAGAGIGVAATRPQKGMGPGW